MQPGNIYRHEEFYRSNETGNREPKYLILLATLPSGDPLNLPRVTTDTPIQAFISA
jgi:hypothetical protein